MQRSLLRCAVQRVTRVARVKPMEAQRQFHARSVVSSIPMPGTQMAPNQARETKKRKPDQTLNVAIIGGGIGGLSLARELQARQHNVQVYERSPEFKAVGAGHALVGGGVLIKDFLGLGDELRKILCPLVGLKVETKSGKELVDLDLTPLYEDPVLKGCIGTVLRADLQELLEKSLLPGTLHFGVDVTSVEQDEKSVTLQTKKSSGSRSQPHTVQADIVVACDGVHSFIRELLPEGKLYGPVHSGLNVWYGVARVPPSIREHIPFGTVYQVTGPGEVALGFDAGHNGDWVFSYTYQDDEPEEDRWTMGANEKELATLLNDFPPPFPEAIASAHRIMLLGVYRSRIMRDTWHDKRVVLLGDACHAVMPFTGQGANMAIEDAVVLAEKLDEVEDVRNLKDLDKAFAAYHALRLPHVLRSSEISERLGKIETWKGKVASSARDTTLQMYAKSGALLERIKEECYPGIDKLDDRSPWF